MRCNTVFCWSAVVSRRVASTSGVPMAVPLVVMPRCFEESSCTSARTSGPRRGYTHWFCKDIAQMVCRLKSVGEDVIQVLVVAYVGRHGWVLAHFLGGRRLCLAEWTEGCV